MIRRRSNTAPPLPAHTIVGDATEEDILREADVEGADFFVAATAADEVNFMSAHLAKQAGARQTIALHNRDDLREVMQGLGVDHPIAPGVITAGALMKVLHSRAMVRLDWVEGGGELVEIEVAEGSPATRAPAAEARAAPQLHRGRSGAREVGALRAGRGHRVRVRRPGWRCS